MRESLNPSLPARLSQWLRPDWTRTVLARRLLAGALVVLAGVAALRPDPAGDRASVVVAVRDISPGTALSAADVALESRLATTLPDGASVDLTTALGATAAGPVRRGEVLTDVRLLGRRLTEATAGPDARLVPIHPADSALAELLRPGDVVDVVAASEAAGTEPSAGSRVVASGGTVVMVSAGQKSTGEDKVVLIALPTAAAQAVAGAALLEKVTLILR